MSIAETRILADDDILPGDGPRPRPQVRRGPLIDPLGYDTADIRQVAMAMAEAAESGRNRDAVRAEIRAVERRLRISTTESSKQVTSSAR
jgi:hypothetical protein